VEHGLSLRQHHTSVELAQIANAVKPGLLIIYHRGDRGEQHLMPAAMNDILLGELRQTYKGEVVPADDLDSTMTPETPLNAFSPHEPTLGPHNCGSPAT
jgi:hypothetical protein